MIISPPFLPDGDVNQSQSIDDFVDGLMGRIDRGKFPVSSHLRWHGGVHLQAPESDEKSVRLINRVPVRAIADGKVLYVRQPTPEVKDPHPLNNMGKGGWCDDGCVVIQHDTEIGEDLAVTFYSIYMHLKSIEATVTTGSEIHRKGKLGQAGQIYGNEGLIHFEIVADEANTKKFLGDLAFSAPSYYTNQYQCEEKFRAQNGRTDACFGSMYFFVPKFIPLFDKPDILSPSIVRQTTVDLTQRNYTPFSEQKTVDITQTEPEEALISRPTPITVGQHMYVEMAFDKGKCTFTSYDEDGKQIGDPVVTQGDSRYKDAVHEYNLYQASLKLYPSKPTAGFELLRFGRVIGDEDFAATESITHFRRIQTPQGVFWIDLNNKNIKKYSDADFPYWKGWGVVNDDTKPTDGRSDSAIINKMIQENWQKKSISAQLLFLTPTANRNVDTDYNEKTYKEKSELLDAELDTKMGKLFCKFPTEWQTSDFDTRYDWVKKEIFDNNEEQFQDFKKHAEALAFWEKAGLTLDKNHWHFPPVEFIKHFRKCAWLSEGEFKQTFVPYVEQKSKWYPTGIKRASDLLGSLRVNLNKSFRKYCINTPLRMAGFLANAFEETIWMTTLEEKSSYWYQPWGGRGILQLTHPENYATYWKFLGKTISNDFKSYQTAYGKIAHMKGNDVRKEKMKVMQDANYPNLAEYHTLRKRISNKELEDPTDSSGFYWVSRSTSISKYADEPQQLEAVLVGTKAYYRSPSFWKVANVVNYGSYSSSRTQYGTSINGFPERCCGYTNCLLVLTELKFPDGKEKLEIPKGWKQRDIHGNDPK
ncbi:M23 family metallopeptidase [Commensalibacter oyaizuii]|uniref:M23 family metallopeptidase n=1 Tax=Commensalibacter oyaizuii TaxID=3043873 RepID=A0ABT6Q5L6_9PROT|nr:M23 family metallopeptidase [Commensalibacter sp. TBRC 16381]MDI2091856.1 M23 family metallopeptidase [Commensalibacter sp. TBRC 16381]